ncbi:glycoside hydrolase family 3 C-terminal domain-containing protein [Microbulbifer sp. YPW1]|uniref:glycoside hydrolase family 3 C-terminal domain-containing protein n=1 Tax=Microbulbifer sp. YPW1 TaxID=2745199 RepID=UPI001597CCF0|nr:glycoside hydrolase family 3 C-terminal domain-containing protein [Microbulbifer sp. YPW1]QKX17223.1 glycoside hydrolase family 3 C-terminal domain-containing protein [Microbulbifer sp. YPW1]
MYKILSLPLCALLIAACSERSADSTDHAGSVVAPFEAGSLPYLDTALPIPQRVDDLVERMTLSEKVAQLYNDAPAIERLGVPKYDWWNEALHGVARAGKATVFPQAIGLAATFDDQMLGEVATAISDEARAKHHYFADNGMAFRYTGLTFWSPNINIFRDPRWGRGQETYGEDPYLTGQMAVSFISGLQGDHPRYLKTAAMAKHFAVHSGPEKSRHSDDYWASRKDLAETYFPAFKTAVVDADVEAVMCAYNRVNGEPACGSDMLLKETLRDQWHFDGHVVSDCGAIADFYEPDAHNLVQAPAEAAAWALKAGTDVNCGTGRLSTFANLGFALQREMIDERDIDTAVKRLFTTRFKLGMFDPAESVPYTQIPMSVVGSEEHLALAETAAEKSMVLLKNDGVLPLAEGTRVAVIGPNATNFSVLVGNYHGSPIKPVTPLEGIRSRAGADKVVYAPGSSLIADQYGHYEIVNAENLFHRDANGKLQAGLNAEYFPVDLTRGEKARDFRYIPATTLAESPAFTRIDPEVDFYWARSPVDDTVNGDFGVVWKGVLVPRESGNYLFKTGGDLSINGQPVEGAVALEAGQEYTLSLSDVFLRTVTGAPLEPEVRLMWVNTSRDYAAEALEVARGAEVIIYTGGISAELEGEEMPVVLAGFDGGDRTDLKLPAVQRDLLRKLKALGKPIVMVNFSGSAMALNWEDKNLNAIVQAFYPGEATGTALARLLWGDANPSGRLPVTFYRSVDDLPGFKDYSFASRTYRYFTGEVLYPFGHGLSYTEFAYSDLKVPEAIAVGEDLAIEVTLSNLGERAGGEISQVYLSLPDAPVEVPLRELKAFTHTQLDAGDSAELSFVIDSEDLAYVDNEGIFQPYHGRLKLTVGSGQGEYLQAPQVAQASVMIQ